MGAPLLTAELADQITNFVTDGASVEDAAGAVGVHKSTVFRWQARGREAIASRAAGSDPAASDDLFVAFAEGLETARYKSKVEAIRMWRKAILGWDEKETTTVTVTTPDGKTTTRTTIREGHNFDYRAVVEWLERRYPKEFGRLIRQEITGPDVDELPIEERVAALVAEVESALAQEDGAPSEP